MSPEPIEQWPEKVWIGQEKLGGRVTERFLAHPDNVERDAYEFIDLKLYLSANRIEGLVEAAEKVAAQGHGVNPQAFEFCLVNTKALQALGEALDAFKESRRHE